MPNTLTLLDIAKFNGRDGEVGLIDETTKAIPEISGFTYYGATPTQIPGVGDSRTIKGVLYKTLVRVGLPTVGFRKFNQGVDRTKSRFENRLVEAFLMNPRWGIDVALANSSEDDTPESLLATEAGAHTQSAMQTVGKQFYYGIASGLGDAGGFPGLLDALDTANMVVDAGGTTESTCSSCWLVKWGVQAVRWVWGMNGRFEASEVSLRDMADADGKQFTGMHQELYAHPGLQVIDTRTFVRIKKLTADAGKGLTDALVADALAKFPAGIMPDVAFMTRRSRSQLQKSRTATNATGTPAPMPTESHGIPIAITESLLDTETLAL